jgi:hypothetical protein
MFRQGLRGDAAVNHGSATSTSKCAIVLACPESATQPLYSVNRRVKYSLANRRSCMSRLHQVIDALKVSLPAGLKGEQSPSALRALASKAEDELSEWVQWPHKALLLWKGCMRKPELLPEQWIEWLRTQDGPEYWKYIYPADLDIFLRRNGISPDRRMNNGPAQSSFRLACGNGPPSGWEHHHLYDGLTCEWHRKNSVSPLHAVNHPLHFTQSSGIVAMTTAAHHEWNENGDFVTPPGYRTEVWIRS